MVHVRLLGKSYREVTSLQLDEPIWEKKGGGREDLAIDKVLGFCSVLFLTFDQGRRNLIPGNIMTLMTVM